jgi:DNA-binding IclR family transcriptional regulator
VSAAAGDLRARQPKAIHSALTVLEEVARCGAGVTARQVSDNLGLPRATTYRLLNLLVQDEYLVRMPDLRGFALGRKVVELAQLVAPARPPEAVRLLVTELRGRIRGGVHLVRYDRDGLHVIDPDPDFPPSVTAVGSRPLHESAMGRLMLAERDSATATEVPELGYARQFDTVSPGSGCLAVPIRDRDGTLVAALCLAAPRARIEQPGEHLLLLQQAALTLAPLLA